MWLPGAILHMWSNFSVRCSRGPPTSGGYYPPYSVRDLYKLTGCGTQLRFVIGTIEGMGRHCLCPVPKENVLVTQGLAHSFEEHL